MYEETVDGPKNANHCIRFTRRETQSICTIGGLRYFLSLSALVKYIDERVPAFIRAWVRNYTMLMGHILLLSFHIYYSVICTRVFEYECVCMCVYMYVYMRVSLCVCVCVCECACVWL